MDANRIETCAGVLTLLGLVAYVATCGALLLAIFTAYVRLSFAEGAVLAFGGACTGALLQGAGAALFVLADVAGSNRRLRDDVTELRRRFVDRSV